MLASGSDSLRLVVALEGLTLDERSVLVPTEAVGFLVAGEVNLLGSTVLELWLAY